MSKSTVLVTGSAGCIGAWVIKQLLEAGQHAVAFDVSDDRRRLSLLVGDEKAQSVPWEVGDIIDRARVMTVVEKHQPDAIIHLAALQVPFCKNDPTLGAQVNVVGSINIFEAARHAGIKRLAYASSVAATAMPEQTAWLKTLYGAYKLCNEQSAQVYWNDWSVPSVCIRPSVIYGVARDQGMSALPTLAILAACLNQPFTIGFSGNIGFVYAQEAAAAFIQAVKRPQSGATVFDLNGTEASVAQFVQCVKKQLPQSNIAVTGEALPFPSNMSNAPLRAHIGAYEQVPLEAGITATISRFKHLIEQKKLTIADIK